MRQRSRVILHPERPEISASKEARLRLLPVSSSTATVAIARVSIDNVVPGQIRTSQARLRPRAGARTTLTAA